MKKKSILILFVIGLFVFGVNFKNKSEEYKNPLRSFEDLLIMKKGYPRVFYFRQTERPEYYLDYEDWQNEWDDLMGVQGKVLAEELTDRNLKHVKYFSQFKKDHPDQLVLLHYNGNACDPQFETKEFFDGHWLYTNGTKIIEDLPQNWSFSKIKVEDASLFVEFTGRFFDKKEDIAIVALDENDNPDWFHCEQAIIREIDYKNNILTIVRGAYKSQPKSFKAGKAKIVAHVVEGPWFGGSETKNVGNNLMWYYNHASTCPRDEKGRNCNDVIAEIMAKRFKPGGDLYYFDGFELDVLWSTLENNSYFYLQGLGTDKRRAPDTDGDGVADMGFVNGVNVYEIGVNQFIRKMREELDKVDSTIIFQADVGIYTQKGFGILNGVESEGYGRIDDGVMTWSNVLNPHCFWNVNSRKPNFSYLNHKFHSDRWATHRVAFSAAMYSGSVIAQYTDPHRNTDGTVGIYDEFVKGEDNELGWLGQPVGDAVHMADFETNLLADYKPSKKLINSLQFVNCQPELSKGTIKIHGKDSTKWMKVIIPKASLPKKEFTLALKTRSEAKTGYSPEYAREIWVRPTDKNSTSLRNSHEWWFHSEDRRYSYTNHQSFTSYIFFHDVKQTEAYIEISFESHEPVYIEDIKLFAAPDAMYREFENGLVITNPGLYEFTFNLVELMPGKKYRRIKGTEFQDPEANNGKPVGDMITLGKHDALFLVRE